MKDHNYSIMVFRDKVTRYPRLERRRAKRGGKRPIQCHNLGAKLEIQKELRKRDQVMRGLRNKRAGIFEPEGVSGNR